MITDETIELWKREGAAEKLRQQLHGRLEKTAGFAKDAGYEGQDHFNKRMTEVAEALEEARLIRTALTTLEEPKT